ncbi:MAG: hypothetical protein WBJ21_05190 [Burkholderiaceae bacterium]
MKPFLILLLVSGLAAAGNLPEGFAGLPWGAPLAALPNAQQIAGTQQYQCYRTGDKTSVIAGADLSQARLCFSDDRFYFAQMEFSGQDNQDNLLAYGKAMWGEPKLGQRFTDAYVWGGPQEGVYIELEFSKNDDRGTLAYVYLPIYKQTQEAAKAQRAKPRPGSGF